MHKSVADLLEEHITLSSDLALAGTPVSTRSPRELEIDKTTAAISVCAPVDKLNRMVAAAVRTTAADITRAARLNPMSGPD